jgi:DNA repair exonuclease SbcCD ATPase subunit
MSGQKIKSILIKGFRGIRNQIVLPLSEKSGLFYGDNGTGKSSIADAIEWFYKDDVEHLASKEIDKGALRNFNLSEVQPASVQLTFTNSKLTTEKTLSLKREKIATEFSNQSSEFLQYLSKSGKENILLRYRNLAEFINGTKGDKLKYLSEIIGYGEVTKIKDALRKTFNSLKNEIKSKGFENQIANQQKVLLDQLGAVIYDEQQLFKQLNEIIKPLDTGVEINSFRDIDTIIEKIKKPTDNQVINELAFLQRCKDTLSVLRSEIEIVHGDYVKFYVEFKRLFDDVENIKQILLLELLNAGKSIIAKKIFTQDNCPLCLQPKSQADLLTSLETRISEISTSSEKLKTYEKARESIKQTIEQRIKRLELLSTEPLMNSVEYNSIKSGVSAMKTKLGLYHTEISLKILAGKMVKPIDDLKFEDGDFSYPMDIEERNAFLKSQLPKDSNADIRVKIEFAKAAFLSIQKLLAEREVLQKQKDSVEVVYNEFVRKQKEGIESFLNTFSSEINEYYQFMNPGEAFEDLKIVPMQEEDELKGITVQFKFNGTKVSPPQKYFSESHLNCYGIAFFLASVKAFNVYNKFIVLDDVISSFDSNHRKRFADLLLERFGDYQIILLTHEVEWFSYVKELAKRKSWHIHEIKWSERDGTHLAPSPSELRELIIYQIENSQEAQLGNTIRRYLEQILKNICFQLEAKTSFRFNNQNEKRMADELLNELKSLIGKKSTDLKSQMTVIDRVANSNVLGNLLSHDNLFNPKMGDLRAFWNDIESFENLLYCNDCKCPVSTKYYDSVNAKVRCKCGQLSYDWKK